MKYRDLDVPVENRLLPARERAKELVLKKYAWDYNAKQTLEIYKEVLANAK